MKHKGHQGHKDHRKEHRIGNLVHRSSIVSKLRGSERVRDRHRARGRHCSPGRAGHAIVPERPSGNATRSTQWRCRATLAVESSGASVPVRREAVGVPSAWSQSSNHPPTRPRRWCDAGPPPNRRRIRRPVLQEADEPHTSAPTGTPHCLSDTRIQPLRV